MDYNAITKSDKILYKIKDKVFSTQVSHEHGNYEYLMANDLDTKNPYVQGELKYWGKWLLETTKVDGFRIDACKHIRMTFFVEWLDYLHSVFPDKELFSVGEYWDSNISNLLAYIDGTGGRMSLFDAPLHFNLSNASNSYNRYDMRTILENTLVQKNRLKAVTFVENHDTQPCQMLESTVQDWFKPLAYAIILLRQGGYPCVF